MTDFSHTMHALVEMFEALEERLDLLEDRVASLEFLMEEEEEVVDPVVEEAKELFDEAYADELDELRDAFVAGYLEGAVVETEE